MDDPQNSTRPQTSGEKRPSPGLIGAISFDGIDCPVCRTDVPETYFAFEPPSATPTLFTDCRATNKQLIAFVNYMTQLLISIGYVANLVVTFTRGSASAQRIMEVLDARPALAQTATDDAQLPARAAGGAVYMQLVSHGRSSRPRRELVP